MSCSTRHEPRHSSHHKVSCSQLCVCLSNGLEHLGGRNSLVAFLFKRNIWFRVTKRKLLFILGATTSIGRSISDIAGSSVQMILSRVCLSQLSVGFCWPLSGCWQPQAQILTTSVSTRGEILIFSVVPQKSQDCFSLCSMHGTVARGLAYARYASCGWWESCGEGCKAGLS